MKVCDLFCKYLAIILCSAVLIIQSCGTREDNSTQPNTEEEIMLVDGVWAGASLLSVDDVVKKYAGWQSVSCDIASTKSGTAIAVWKQFDGNQSNIMAASFTSENGWGTALQISSEGDTFDPKVAINSDENAIVTWAVYNGETGHSIGVAHYDANSGWGDEYHINERIFNFYDVMLLDNGTAFLLFDMLKNDIFSKYCLKYTPTLGWTEPFRLTSDNGNSYLEMDLAVSLSGKAIAVWQQYADADSGKKDKLRHIWGSIYDPINGWSEGTIVGRGNVGDSYSPSAGIDEKGNAVVLWEEDGIIWSNRYESPTGWLGKTQISGENVTKAWHPALAADRTGRMLAVWKEWDKREVGGTLWSAHFHPNTGWQLPIALPAETAWSSLFESGESKPSIVMTNRSNAVVVWDRPSNPQDIIVAVYSGEHGWGNVQAIDAVATSKGFRPQAIADHQGGVIVIWCQATSQSEFSPVFTVWANQLIAREQ